MVIPVIMTVSLPIFLLSCKNLTISWEETGRILLWYSKKLSRLNLPLKSSCG